LGGWIQESGISIRRLLELEWEIKICQVNMCENAQTNIDRKLMLLANVMGITTFKITAV
jgi:hypothetical protein